MIDLTDFERQVLRHAIRRWYRSIEDGSTEGWIDPSERFDAVAHTTANISFLKALEAKIS